MAAPSHPLRERFARECPHVDLGYVDIHCPHLLKRARRYNAAREVAQTWADVDALVKQVSEIRALAEQ